MGAPVPPLRPRRHFAASLRALATAACLIASPVLPAEEPAPGDDWSAPAELSATDLLLAAQRIDGRIVAAGARGHILVSDDDGESWNQARVPTRSTLTALHFVSPDEGWVVGHDSIILHTADGGETWEIQRYAPEDEKPLLDVWFGDAENGLAVGAYGLMLATSDGGQNWDEVIFEPGELDPYVEDDEALAGSGDENDSESEDEWWDVEELAGDYHLNDILESDGVLFIAAEAGNLYRSDDGINWVTLPSDYDGSFFGLIEAGDGRLIAAGLRGHAYYSDDRGDTWHEADIPVTSTLNSGTRLADGSIVVAGLGGYLLYSDDNGLSFSATQQENRKGIQEVLEVGEGELLTIGEAGAQVVRRGSGNE